jgi:hypothetical protein
MYKVNMNHEVMGLKKMKLNFTNLYLRRCDSERRIFLNIFDNAM